MSQFANPDFAASVTASFNKQNAMKLIRATLPVVEHGRTEIHVPHWEGIEQQHGFVHGGVVGMIADSAAGYAAMTMVPDASVLTVEFQDEWYVNPGIGNFDRHLLSNSRDPDRPGGAERKSQSRGSEEDGSGETGYDRQHQKVCRQRQRQRQR